jgi:hypothetical protein
MLKSRFVASRSKWRAITRNSVAIFISHSLVHRRHFRVDFIGLPRRYKQRMGEPRTIGCVGSSAL